MMRKAFVVMALVTGIALIPSVAHAGEDQAEASPTGKGIVGGALLGGEAVMLFEAALDVKPWWAYAVGGISGGIAGGVGGYFAEQNASTKVNFYLLTGGMALVIPTTVAVLSASAYDPPVNYTEDQGPVEEPAAEPAQPTGSRRARQRVVRRWSRPRTIPQAPRPPSLVDVGEGKLSLSVPTVEVRDVFTRDDLHRYGVKQRTEFRVPVLNYVF